MALKAKLIGERLVNVDRGQKQVLRSHYEIGPYRVRVKANIDASYSYQSSPLKAEVWKPNLGWVEVAAFHYAELQGSGSLELHRVEQVLLERTRWVLESE
jgi:hypothetical protein